MNILTTFEQRVSAIFDTTSQGYRAPFSFKKLAKQAVREMEKNTVEIQGVMTAPALYTILVSPSDDNAIRPCYGSVTLETAQMIEAQAARKGYLFVGEPLVRFMVDPSLRSGRFSVFAENVDARTLEALWAEEDSYLDSLSGSARRPNYDPVTVQPVQPMQPMQPMQDVQPRDVPQTVRRPMPGEAPMPVPVPAPMPIPEPIDAPAPIPVAAAVAASAAEEPVDSALDSSQDLSAGLEAIPFEARAEDSGALLYASEEQQRTAEPASAPQCMLVDHDTGRTYTATGPLVRVGRERANSDIIISDPNVSRAHCRLTWDGTVWHIEDLDSTNGTIVNNVDVRECTLRDGDLIILGLVNLEFREVM